ncbi:Chaperone protein ClpB [Caulifigura coniformis]|uniref:Chaperone protein ClpB n=1 Tax=Caulifigura coniformis TaxID=2527983 RepID=A0A517SI57_9PLAN|nr:type VI secretion system ATPase TssH [Caulifigura coniformis]QDT55795.1 Chaperone protein ClpB [Caulifigura coniformis]
MDVSLRSLVGKLNEPCRRSLESAAGLCLSRTNYTVEVEHWLQKLLELPDTDVAAIFKHYEVDHSRLQAALTKAIDGFKTGNARPPALSPLLVDLVRDAWVFASIEYNETAVRSGHLLLAALTNTKVSQLFLGSVKDLGKLTPDGLSRELKDVTAGTSEDVASVQATQSATSTGAAPAAGNPKTPALNQFTVDLTERARSGALDSVSGRDFEIRQLIDILMRRRQNNPILTGEAGVGKTAVVEGFAQRIAAGDVPPPLRGVAVRSLDLGLLQAGAGVKGEFENRLKSVIQEVKASPQPIILFIDEAHTLIGAGGQAGQNDAANLLKPALARGELRTICATTWSEYKQYFEKDAALTRRFQVVKVEEPAERQAEIMLQGLVKMLEKHHGLRILDEAVAAAVKLSMRYITGRQLPDKAVSLLDTAAARVAVGQSATPAAVEDLARQIEQDAMRLEILEREAAAGADHAVRMEELKAGREKAIEELKQMESRWTAERDLVTKICELRDRLAGTPIQKKGGSDEKAPPPTQLAESEKQQLREELTTLQAELKGLQGEAPLVQPCVNFAAIAEVVSAWTGIPVGKMLTDEIRLVSSLHERMTERVIGQNHALTAISRRIQTARANLTDPKRPIGVFLLVGPSGVGKTETAMTLAEMLYGGERNMVIINMTEFQQGHTTSTLIGSAPGLVGYGKGGKLTEAVRRRPYCVVLLDEIEKAHDDVLELFYQVFDKGVLEDAEGREIDFKNTIILCTSNVGSELIQSLCADPDTKPDSDKLGELLRPKLLERFKPAFLGRMTVVPYFSLGDEVLKSIIRLQLGRIGERLKENHRAQLTFPDAVVDHIASRCKETETGARNVDHILTGSVLPDISRELLSRMADERSVARVTIDLAENSGFRYEFE